MTVEDQIQALLAKADALRDLPEEDQGDLADLVDQINALRAIQASGRVALDVAIQARDEAEFVAVADEVAKRKPGRPRKAE